MSDKSKIEWTEKTWSPITGCTPYGPGCENCYAKRFAKRLKAMGSKKYRNGFDLTIHHRSLEEPLKWRKPSMILVNSMSDTFHKNVPQNFINSMFCIMRFCKRHTFQVLTKRPQNIPLDLYWPKNVWLGITICTQEEADKKIPVFLNVNAKVHFLSIEPMLEEIDLGNFWHRTKYVDSLDWVIAGSESGPCRRHVPIEYFRKLKNQCVNSNVPFFFKQFSCGNIVQKMPPLDGKIWNQYPEIN